MNNTLKKMFAAQQYKGVPVVTVSQLTEILSVGSSTVRSTLYVHRDKFKEGIHYYKLSRQELLSVKQKGVIPVNPVAVNLTLLTEEGVKTYLSLKAISHQGKALPNKQQKVQQVRLQMVEKPMQQSLVTVSGTRCYIDENQIAWLNAEDVARGLGFVKTEDKVSTTNGRKTYETIRWARVNEYLHEFGFANKVAKDDFIPENMFYRLAMKANNEIAQVFQAKVADEILPTLRRTGSYKVPKKTIKEIEHDIKTIKGQEVVVYNLSSQVAIAQQRLDEAQRSLEQAKQNHLLELTVYQEMCKEHGIKPEPNITSSLTEDKNVVTLQYFYDKVKLQYPLLTMSKVYDLAVKQGYSLTGAFDRGRAEISKNDALSLYKAIQDQTITVENLISATTEQTKTTKDILQQLATTTRTIKEVIEVLNKKNIKNLADKNLNATNLISCLRSQKLDFSPAPKKKNYHSEDSTIPPATILALEHFLS